MSPQCVFVNNFKTNAAKPGEVYVCLNRCDIEDIYLVFMQNISGFFEFFRVL